MARRTPKLPIASGRGLQIELVQDDWARLEKAYGYKLADPLRVSILKLTNTFLLSAEFEQTAPDIKEAEEYISAVRNSVRELSKAIRGRTGLAVFKARQLLREHADLPAGGDNDVISHLVWHILPELARACDAAMAELSELGVGNFCTGASWEAWILELAELLRAQRLPAGARKDASRKSGKTTRQSSPFVALVWELQKCMPSQFRRTTQSHDALAAMVTRARATHVEKVAPNSER